MKRILEFFARLFAPRAPALPDLGEVDELLALLDQAVRRDAERAAAAAPQVVSKRDDLPPITHPAPAPQPPAPEGRRLAPNFTLAELIHSDTAARNGWYNTPDPAAIANLRALATNVLQPIRDRFGPVRITSGYRNDRLNRAVGGAPTSQHRTGEAADFSVAGATQEQVHRWIVANLRFDQLILYKSGRFHISYSATRARWQVLRR
jgi:hypothetical protein